MPIPFTEAQLSTFEKHAQSMLNDPSMRLITFYPTRDWWDKVNQSFIYLYNLAVKYKKEKKSEELTVENISKHLALAWKTIEAISRFEKLLENIKNFAKQLNIYPETLQAKELLSSNENSDEEKSHTQPNTNSSKISDQASLFLLPDETYLADLIAKLKSSGLTDDYFVRKGDYLYLNTENTLLRIESIQEVNCLVRSLFYGDIKICSTRTDSEQKISFLETLYGLPNCLVKEAKTEEKSSTEKAHKILFPVKRPFSALEQQHLSYLGIRNFIIYLDNDQMGYYLKLPGNSFFSVFKTRRVNSQDTAYWLQYKTTTIAHTVIEHKNKYTVFNIHSIARALGKLDNLLSLPVRINDDNWAAGTIESCINGIKNNLYTGFSQESLDPDLEEKFQYKFDHDKLNLLIAGLRVNTSLKDIKLTCITLTKTDLLALIEAVKNNKNLKSFVFCACRFEITADDFSEIYNAIDDLPIDFANSFDKNGFFVKQLLLDYANREDISQQEIYNKKYSFHLFNVNQFHNREAKQDSIQLMMKKR